MSRFSFEFGPSLEKEPGEVAALAEKVRRGKVTARMVKSQPDGDIRYWNVDPAESPVLERLMEYGKRRFQDVTGKPPASAFIMVNHIAASRSPQGSGGAWHRDSLRMQYKAFVYLTDVDSEAKGPFCYLSGSNSPWARFLSLVGWLLAGRTNHNQPTWVVKTLDFLGFERRAVTAAAGQPFFANTSLIHRGLPITKGERIAATVYMLSERDPPFKVDGMGMM